MANDYAAVAQVLVSAHYATFGGKTKGSYIITHQKVRQLLDEPLLTDVHKHNLTVECLRLGFMFVDLGDEFFVNRMDKTWRPLPKRVHLSMMKTLGITIDPDEEDDADNDAESSTPEV